MRYGFFRAAAASPSLAVADCFYNAENIITQINIASQKKAELVVFPELCITGYTCSDLFFQKSLQETAISELERIAKETSNIPIIAIVGLPLAYKNALYNVAAILFKGKILCLIPKTFIPNYNEFYERRHFASGAVQNIDTEIFLSEKNPSIPFGTNILITDKFNTDFVLGTEICEDVWSPCPPSVSHTLNGATIIANLSASNEIIGKAEYRRLLLSSHSAKTISAYVYADAGHDESTQDLVFASHNLICENGKILSESKLFTNEIIFADIDLERINQERRKTITFQQTTELHSNSKYRFIEIEGTKKNYDKDEFFFRQIEDKPFVPSSKEKRAQRCLEVITLQAEGLSKRLRHINAKSAVIGLSGGLDSTLALLVTAKAFDLCSIPRNQIQAVTMPCFGTTDRTYKNACTISKQIGATLLEIPIADAVKQHFHDIGQDENTHDVTYENSQARERTQILMDIANKTNGIVIGTGDLSELALGWATYNGDHMSMYGVNSSIPKTLVRHLVNWFSEDALPNKELSDVLNDILDTPVSPELLPPTNGNISQKTEELVGPYELHDFFLYYVLRFGFSPKKILFLANKAFNKIQYSDECILKWLKVFYKRFFSQQFKRSCLPDGAKVGTINLSPRGDWRMPSDASVNVWLKELDE